MTFETDKVVSFLADEASKHIAEHPYMFIQAYNRMCEDERDGNGMILDLDNTDDFKKCAEFGFTRQDITPINTGFYGRVVFGSPKHQLYKTSVQTACEIIKEEIHEVMFCVISYPWVDEYKQIYINFVTSSYLEE